MIYLGADHAGFALKEAVKKWLDKKKILYQDLGNTILDLNDDYPDFAEKVAREVAKSKGKAFGTLSERSKESRHCAAIGVLFCGSAEGVCIAANKIRGIRAVNPCGKIQAKFSRRHEDANVLCLAGGGSRQKQPGLNLKKAVILISAFLKTPFSGAARHVRRLKKIEKIELYG